MAGERVEADRVSAGGADPSGFVGGHGRHFRWNGSDPPIFGVVTDDGREWGWHVVLGRWCLLASEERRREYRAFYGAARYAEGASFPPPVGRRDPELPGVEVTCEGRVQVDEGRDGSGRRWPRWWCSCGAHGFGWPRSHQSKES